MVGPVLRSFLLTDQPESGSMSIMTQSSLFGDEPSPKVKSTPVDPRRVQGVFDYWVEVHHKRSDTALDTTRTKVITKALHQYPLETIKLAIDGCAKSDWHMGQNPGGKRYNDITLILRNAQKIEQFAELAMVSLTAEDELDEWRRS